MNSCGNAYCYGGPCTCNLYYGHSMFYSHEYQQDENNYPENMYSFASSPSSSSSSVDCTLSLGTPSTRLSTNENNHHEKRVHESSSSMTHERRSSSSYMSKCWNILQNKNNHKSGGRSTNNNINNNVNNSGSNADPLVARRCANCDTTSTPLWRNGPRGPKSLCNACGIRYKKEEKRASAAAAANGNGMENSTQHTMNGSWVHHSQAQIMPCYSSAYGNNEFRFIEDHDDRDSDNEISFWPFLASQHC